MQEVRLGVGPLSTKETKLHCLGAGLLLMGGLLKRVAAVDLGDSTLECELVART